MPRRHDPEVEAPVDGAPDHSKVDGKDPRFDYLWAHPDDLRHRMFSRTVTAGNKKVRVDPWIACERGKEDSEEFAGYGSVSTGSNEDTYIRNGELVLLKRPKSEGKKQRKAEEEINQAYDKRIYGEVAAMKAAGVPVTADISESIEKSE